MLSQASTGSSDWPSSRVAQSLCRLTRNTKHGQLWDVQATWWYAPRGVKWLSGACPVPNPASDQKYLAPVIHSSRALVPSPSSKVREFHQALARSDQEQVH